MLGKRWRKIQAVLSVKYETWFFFFSRIPSSFIQLFFFSFFIFYFIFIFFFSFFLSHTSLFLHKNFYDLYFIPYILSPTWYLVLAFELYCEREFWLEDTHEAHLWSRNFGRCRRRVEINAFARSLCCIVLYLRAFVDADIFSPTFIYFHMYHRYSLLYYFIYNNFLLFIIFKNFIHL